jgi:hypothetical protein
MSLDRAAIVPDGQERGGAYREYATDERRRQRRKDRARAVSTQVSQGVGERPRRPIGGERWNNMHWWNNEPTR